jgi:hypothetical protein
MKQDDHKPKIGFIYSKYCAYFFLDALRNLIFLIDEALMNRKAKHNGNKVS